jgi:hypothetical protein
MDISSPKLEEGHPDRSMKCHFTLEPGFQEFVRQAQAAGWTEDEVADAMLNLAHNHLTRIVSVRETP